MPQSWRPNRRYDGKCLGCIQIKIASKGKQFWLALFTAQSHFLFSPHESP